MIHFQGTNEQLSITGKRANGYQPAEYDLGLLNDAVSTTEVIWLRMMCKNGVG